MKRFTNFLLIGLMLSAYPLLALAGNDQSTGEWFGANWLWICSILCAACSEIIGASPLKSNTVIGVIMWILKRIIGKVDRPL